MNREDFRKVANPLGFVSAEPKPTPEELKQFYADRYYQGASGGYQQSYDDDELSHKQLRADLTMHAVRQAQERMGFGGKRFLEVGFGEGFLLHSAIKAEFDVHGVDFSEFGIKAFHPELIGHVEVGDAYELLQRIIDSGRRFDICVLQNVLEHVIDPAAMLDSIRHILGPDSLLVLQLPNDYSHLQTLAMEKGHVEEEFWFLPPGHLSFFNIDNAKAFVASQNYQVLDVFGDFPIDFFLFHPGSNYVRDKNAGKGAHRARIELDLLLARNGLDAYLNFCRALTACGLGRNFALIVRPND